MAEIEEVVFKSAEHFLHRVGVSVAQGGDRCYARATLIERFVARIVFHDLFDEESSFGTVADKGHVSRQYIEELRKFVEMAVSQEFAHFGQAFVVVSFEKLGSVGFGVASHAAEFVYVERFSSETDAFLPEESRSAVLAFYGCEADHVERGAYKDHGSRSDAVERPFAEFPHRSDSVGYGVYFSFVFAFLMPVMQKKSIIIMSHIFRSEVNHTGNDPGIL